MIFNYLFIDIKDMVMKSQFFLVLTLFCFTTSKSFATQPDPCEKDRMKFCGQYGENDPQRLYCLKTIEPQLSGGCKGYLKNIKGTTSDFIEECSEDFYKFCEQTRMGQGRILECLRSHSRELDFECRKQVNMLPVHESGVPKRQQE